MEHCWGIVCTTCHQLRPASSLKRLLHAVPGPATRCAAGGHGVERARGRAAGAGGRRGNAALQQEGAAQDGAAARAPVAGALRRRRLPQRHAGQAAGGRARRARVRGDVTAAQCRHYDCAYVHSAEACPSAMAGARRRSCRRVQARSAERMPLNSRPAAHVALP